MWKPISVALIAFMILVGVYSYNTVEEPQLGLSVFVEQQGGTNQSSYTAGDILFSDATDSLAKLNIGSNTQVLTLTSGLPAWEDATGGAGDPNVILTTVGGTTYLQASTTANAWLFNTGFVSQASSTINGDFTITGISTTTNIIPSADSASDLGSIGNFWANGYIDKINFNSTVSIDGSIADTLSMTGDIIPSSDNTYVLGAPNSAFSTIYARNIDDRDGIGGITFLADILANNTSRSIGSASTLWNLGFIEEIVLGNDGTGTTAVDTVRLGGFDLSDGNAGLLITTENDTDHLFASLVGIGTTTPQTLLTVAGAFAVGTNGVEFTIDSSGNISSGFVSQASSTITGDFTIDNNFFWDNTNARLSLIDSSNTLTITGSSVPSIFTIHKVSVDNIIDILLERHSSGAGRAGLLVFARSRGDEASPTTVTNNDDLGKINFYGHDGTDYEIAAQILINVDGTVSAGDVPGDMAFLTSADGGSLTQRMIITSAGNVGIGTDSPSVTLHIVGGGSGLGTARITNTGSGAGWVAERTDGESVI